MTAPEADAPAPAPKPGRKFRVEALAVGKEGAVKLMIMTTVEPSNTKKEEYRSRVQAQYRQEFDAWSEGSPKVTVVG